MIVGISTQPSIYDAVFNQPRPRQVGELAEVDAETYEHFLNILPPLEYRGGGFLMLEADCDQGDHTIRSKFFRKGGRYWHQWVGRFHARDVGSQLASKLVGSVGGE